MDFDIAVNKLVFKEFFKISSSLIVVIRSRPFRVLRLQDIFRMNMNLVQKGCIFCVKLGTNGIAKRLRLNQSSVMAGSV